MAYDPRQNEPRLVYWVRVYHPTMLFFGGIAGIIYETGYTNVDRPYLLAVFAAMIGVLPATIFDSILGRRSGNSESPPKKDE